MSFLKSFFSTPQMRALLSSHFFSVLTKLAFAIVLGFAISFIKADFYEAAFYDARVRLHPSPHVNGDIQIIRSDKKTIEALGNQPNIEDHRKVLERIISAKPRFIVYSTMLQSLKGQIKDKEDFAITAGSASFPIYQATDEVEEKWNWGTHKLPVPYQNIPLAAAPKTYDTNILAKDGVTRRMMIRYQGNQLLYPQLAESFNPEIKDLGKIRGVFNIFDSDQVYVDFAPHGSFSTLKFESLPENLDILKDKIVIIGDDFTLDFKDYIKTPYSREDLAMPVYEMRANMINTLINNSAPVQTPRWFDILVTILISILTVEVVLTAKPLKGISILLGAMLAYSLISYVAFWPFGVWMDMAHPFLAIFLCYYFFIPYRLIVESRRSWEYFQKHKLLSEVEQLKTNFIGMMSHDLKTPLARIQGMTDIIQKDPNHISTPQREALDTIKHSADDLLRFISTILNYARIESQGVELHLQPRDINEILKEVIKKHEFLARLKQIQLIAELEPLFSTKADPELLKQVFSNLVENAIKYSPDKSKVLITSEEVDGNIVVQIADQGIGIPADEISNIFMKFFRSKNAKSSPIKGSGLGLYLANYFVELHQGRITCESTPDQGSTFTVELPIKS